MPQNKTEYWDIIENITVQNWFKMLAIKEPLAFSALIGNNGSNIEKLFGSAENRIQEKKISYWKVQDQGMVIIINIDEEEGNTQYLVKYDGEDFENDIKIGSSLIVFLDKILKNISNTLN